MTEAVAVALHDSEVDVSSSSEPPPPPSWRQLPRRATEKLCQRHARWANYDIGAWLLNTVDSPDPHPGPQPRRPHPPPQNPKPQPPPHPKKPHSPPQPKREQSIFPQPVVSPPELHPPFEGAFPSEYVSMGILVPGGWIDVAVGCGATVITCELPKKVTGMGVYDVVLVALATATPDMG